MLNLKNLFTRALLALMLVTGAGAALAGPTYHVTVDTTTYTGTGSLDFFLSAYELSEDNKAYLGNFSGDFTGFTLTEGDASGDIGSGLALTTRDGFAFFAQGVNFGGRFGFDVRFDLASVDPIGFSVGLFSDELNDYLGATGTVVAIELAPGQPDLVSVNAEFASASEVPEPATLASIMLGLTLMGSTLRARRKK